MLKIDLDVERGICRVTAAGEVLSIVTDVLFAAASLYRNMKAHDPQTAAVFRQAFRYGVNDAVTWGTETGGEKWAVVEYQPPKGETNHAGS